MLRILDMLQEQAPTGESWRKELVSRVSKSLNDRPGILDSRIAAAANTTRSFRNLAGRGCGTFDVDRCACDRRGTCHDRWTFGSDHEIQAVGGSSLERIEGRRRRHELWILTKWRRRHVCPNFLDVRAFWLGKIWQHAMKTRWPECPRPSEVVEGRRVAKVWPTPVGNQFAASGPIAGCSPI